MRAVVSGPLDHLLEAMSSARKLPTPQLLLRWGIEHGGAVVTTSTQVGLTNYVTIHL